ncbi:hypothetical protein MRX96_019460 [Rhipicephalus microplus]
MTSGPGRTLDNSEQDHLLCPKRHCQHHQSKLVNGKPPQVPPTSPRNSVASQASSAMLTTPRQRQQEPTYSLENRDDSPEKSGRWMTWPSTFMRSEAANTWLRSSGIHEIDGGALFLIEEHHLMTTRNIKQGPALKMCAAIGSLRKVSQDDQAFGARRIITEKRCSGCFSYSSL